MAINALIISDTMFFFFLMNSDTTLLAPKKSPIMYTDMQSWRQTTQI